METSEDLAIVTIGTHMYKYVQQYCKNDEMNRIEHDSTLIFFSWFQFLKAGM